MELSLASSHDRPAGAFGPTALARAVENDELSLVFQPTISLVDGALTGFEALVRWSHPELGVLAPEAVASPEARYGQARVLSDWTLRSACRQLASWQDEVLVAPGFRVAVNISGMELDGDRLVQSIGTAIRDAGVDARGLVVEVTDACAIDSAGAAAESARGLHELGVELAIDNFGSRYSTFSRLASLPFDVLKLNRDLVNDAGSDRGRLILRSLIEIGQRLDARVVAEGVDTDEHAALLRSLGCHEGQGDAWARALSVTEAEAFLGAGTTGARLRAAV